MDYRYGSHTVFKIQYHFVFVTKYRYKVLKGDVGLKVRELIRQTCEAFEIEILKGVVSQDHVHILVSAPPNLASSEIMRRIKGQKFDEIVRELPRLEEALLGTAQWATD
jgi:putative transposase